MPGNGRASADGGVRAIIKVRDWLVSLSHRPFSLPRPLLTFRMRRPKRTALLVGNKLDLSSSLAIRRAIRKASTSFTTELCPPLEEVSTFLVGLRQDSLFARLAWVLRSGLFSFTFLRFENILRTLTESNRLPSSRHLDFRFRRAETPDSVQPSQHVAL